MAPLELTNTEAELLIQLLSARMAHCEKTMEHIRREWPADAKSCDGNPKHDELTLYKERLASAQILMGKVLQCCGSVAT